MSTRPRCTALLAAASAAALASCALTHCGDRTSGLSSSPDASRGGLEADASSPRDGGSDGLPVDAGGCLGIGCELAPDVAFAPVPCPPAPPSTGATCPVVGEICEYGSSWLPDCNLLLTCTLGGWQKRGAGYCPVAPDASGPCPATWAEARALVATMGRCPAVDCQYPEGACECLTCGAGQRHFDALGLWACVPATAECPTPRPDLGTACDEAGASCAYASQCCVGPELMCIAGVWQGYQLGTCP